SDFLFSQFITRGRIFNALRFTKIMLLRLKDRFGERDFKKLFGHEAFRWSFGLKPNLLSPRGVGEGSVPGSGPPTMIYSRPPSCSTRSALAKSVCVGIRSAGIV